MQIYLKQESTRNNHDPERHKKEKNMTQDLRDNLLNWLAHREKDLRLELKSSDNNRDFVKGELVIVMETTAYILTEGAGF
jgi:CRISPR/Cas system-associated exonuclease Cas4 (RecB family)